MDSQPDWAPTPAIANNCPNPKTTDSSGFCDPGSLPLRTHSTLPVSTDKPPYQLALVGRLAALWTGVYIAAH